MKISTGTCILFAFSLFIASCVASEQCINENAQIVKTNSTYSKPLINLNDMNVVLEQIQQERKLKTVRILGIGNSWSRDSFQYICAMLHDAGYYATVGQAYLGGSTLQQQYFGIFDSSYTYKHNGLDQIVHNTYQYYKYTGAGKRTLTPSDEEYDNGKKGTGVTLESIVSDEPWDIIIFQQSAVFSGIDKGWTDENNRHSFINKDGKEEILSWNINELINAIISMLPKGTPKPRIGISIPWVPAKGTSADTLSQFYNNYNNSVVPKSKEEKTVFYEKSHKIIQEKGIWAARNIVRDCDFIANPGLAIYNARKNKYLSKFGWKMQIGESNTHLANGLPKYVAGMAIINAALGVKHDDFDWYPSVKTNSTKSGKDKKGELNEFLITKETAWIARMCGEIE